MTLRRQATICRLFFFLRLSKQNWLRRHTCKCKVKGNSDDVSSCPVYPNYLGSKWVLTTPRCFAPHGLLEGIIQLLDDAISQIYGVFAGRKGGEHGLPKLFGKLSARCPS